MCGEGAGTRSTLSGGGGSVRLSSLTACLPPLSQHRGQLSIVDNAEIIIHTYILNLVVIIVA